MKKILLATALGIVGACLPVAASFALDPDAPPCVLSLDPTLQYSTVSFDCAAYTDPNTGIYMNAIDIGTPPPKL